MSDVLDTPEGRALVDAAWTDYCHRYQREEGFTVADTFDAETLDRLRENVAVNTVRAVLAATDDQGESIVVLRSRLDVWDNKVEVKRQVENPPRTRGTLT